MKTSLVWNLGEETFPTTLALCGSLGKPSYWLSSSGLEVLLCTCFVTLGSLFQLSGHWFHHPQHQNDGFGQDGLKVPFCSNSLHYYYMDFSPLWDIRIQATEKEHMTDYRFHLTAFTGQVHPGLPSNQDECSAHSADWTFLLPRIWGRRSQSCYISRMWGQWQDMEWHVCFF